MVTDVALAELLDGLPVGDELIELVRTTDPATLDRHDGVARARAISRITAAFEGLQQRQLVEIAHSTWDEPGLPPGGRTEHADEFVHAEIAAGLTWTMRAAGDRLHFAKELLHRLPNVHAAMCQGLLDYPKVNRMLTGVRDVTDLDLARRVVDTILADAPRLTTQQIAGRIRRLIAKLDPDAAKRRAERATKQRHVSAGTDEDGTCWIAAHGIPAGPAAAAMERIDSCARAARRNGDTRTLEQLRADCFIGLLDGTWDGPPPAYRTGVVELTVPLTTLMGLQDLPGDLAGWGPVCADIARQTAAQAGDTTRFAFTVHQDGNVVAHGTTRRPPASVATTVRVRTDRCVAPGCTRPAARCDLDHRIRVADGGATTAGNLHPLCRRHHRCKDEGGWRYQVVAPGVYLWVSPGGHTYIADRRRFNDGPTDDW
jgi:hypothetical protein